MAYDRHNEGDSELLLALKGAEERSTTYLQSELQAAQIDAWQRYHGDPYGDEVEGRSQITTREVYEIVQWLRPDLRRTFTAGDRVFEFEGMTPSADRYAKEATDLVNYELLVANEGERALDEFIFDGLLHRIGIIAADWKENEYSPAQEVSGLNSMQVQALMQAPNVEIVEQDVRQDAPDEAHQDGLYFDLKIRQLTSRARADVFTVAPEDFRVAARAVDLATTSYCGDIVRMMRGEAKLKWPDYADEIDGHQANTSLANSDERRAERFRDQDNWELGGQTGNSEAEEIEIWREYIRYDRDGDGQPEMLRCFRLGDSCLLEAEEVDEHIYSHWTPNPIPHRLIGLGINDEAKDLQRTKTVLLRSALDSVYQSVAPRMGYDKNADVDLDALLTVRPGVAIGVAGPPADKLFPIAVPDLSKSAFDAMQILDRMVQSRTGVSRQASGMNPDLLHDTAKGEELMQNAQGIRTEEIARNLAVGLQQFGMKLYRLLHKHQNEARAVKIAGEWRNIDPRAWEADVRCSVSVGLGTGAKEKQLMLWQMMQGDQVAWVQAYGPGQQYGPRPANMYALARKKYETIGVKNCEAYLGQEPPPDWAPTPPPNPEQAKAQVEQMKLQQQAQIEQMKVQATERQTVLQAEKDMQVATAQQRDEMVRAEMDARNNERQAAQEAAKLQLEAHRAQLEHEREMQRMAFEHQVEQATLALKARELEIKEQELAVRQQEAAAQRMEAQADREHESQENAKARKAAANKPNGGAPK